MNRADEFIRFFTQLTPETVDEIDTIFSANARFKDPFNDVIGVDKIKTVFTHMFETTESPVFIVNQNASNQDKLFIQWSFKFSRNNKSWVIEGSSMVTFDDNNQVIEHIDYWDPAEQIYAKLSILKPFMNFLRSRLTAS